VSFIIRKLNKFLIIFIFIFISVFACNVFSTNSASINYDELPVVSYAEIADEDFIILEDGSGYWIIEIKGEKYYVAK